MPVHNLSTLKKKKKIIHRVINYNNVFRKTTIFHKPLVCNAMRLYVIQNQITIYGI